MYNFNLLNSPWNFDLLDLSVPDLTVFHSFTPKPQTVLFADVDGGPGDDTLTGTNGDDTINGFGGDDEIFGLDGFDTIDAGDGDDIIHYSDDGGGTVDGGAGYDVFEYDANTFGAFIDDTSAGLFLPITIVNNTYNYTLTNIEALEGYRDGDLVALHRIGSGSADVIDLGGQNFETLYIAGGDGNDTLTGGSGTSDGLNIGFVTLFGQGGDDTLLSTADVNSGTQSFYGGTGNDVLTANDNVGHFFVGEAGNDTLNGGTENDILLGGFGDDIINAGAGDDQIGLGVTIDFNDMVGGDVIDAGDGNDLIWITDEGVSVDGGNGNDTLEFFQANTFNDITFTHNATGVATFLGSGLQVQNIENYSLNLDGSGTDVIFLGAGDDTVNANFGADEIHGGDGDDALVAGGSNSTVYGDDGDDYVSISGLSGSIAYGGNGNDSLDYFGAGDGPAFSGTLDGGAGDDIFSVGDSNFTVIGGAGFDRLMILSSATAQDITFTASSTGTATYGPTGGTVEGVEAFDIFLDNGNDTITLLGGDDFVKGEGGDDIIDTGAGDDQIYADGDDDTLTGGAGDDQLYGGDGTDHAVYSGVQANYTVIDNMAGSYTVIDNVGTDGEDYLDSIEFLTFSDGTVDMASAVNDGPINGTSGDDILTGTSGDDEINGLDGDDELRGLIGDDTLDGGDGRDRLEGGDGEDILRGGADTDFMLGGGARDRMFGGDQSDRMFGQDGNDIMNGGGSNDIMYGGGNADIMYGGLGNDNMNGGSNVDRIYGQEGRDIIYGGNAGDQIDGGSGNDMLFGGNRNSNDGSGDTFIFANNFGTDVIGDFEDGLDVIDFSGHTGINSFADVLARASEDGTSLLIATNANNTLIIENFSLAELDVSDFVF